MILFIDACTRRASRTRALAEYLTGKLTGKVEYVRLYEEKLPDVDEEYVNMRSAGDFSHSSFRFAKQFKNADSVVIAAPYWDLSFPSVLKKYFEAICVTGLTFSYSDTGAPISLCRAKKLWYVTTSGGPISDSDFSFGYVKTLCEGFFGVESSYMISAENLDIFGADVDGILESARRRIDELLENTDDKDELSALRDEIDFIDIQLVELFSKRLHICDDIAGVKKKRGLPLTDEAREKLVFDRAVQRAAEDTGDYAVELMRAVVAQSKLRQKKILE